MDWSNEAIYHVNERAPIKITSETAIAYIRFFFYFVREETGQFIIAEQPEDMVWLPEADEEERLMVADLLMPITYQGLDEDGLLTLTCTVIFQNALLKTEIKIVPQEMDVFECGIGD